MRAANSTCEITFLEKKIIIVRACIKSTIQRFWCESQQAEIAALSFHNVYAVSVMYPYTMCYFLFLVLRTQQQHAACRSNRAQQKKKKIEKKKDRARMRTQAITIYLAISLLSFDRVKTEKAAFNWMYFMVSINLKVESNWPFH